MRLAIKIVCFNVQKNCQSRSLNKYENNTVKKKKHERNSREGLENFIRVTNSLTETIELSNLRKLRAMRVVRFLYLKSITGNKLPQMIETLKYKCDSISSQFQKSVGIKFHSNIIREWCLRLTKQCKITTEMLTLF